MVELATIEEVQNLFRNLPVAAQVPVSNIERNEIGHAIEACALDADSAVIRHG